MNFFWNSFHFISLFLPAASVDVQAELVAASFPGNVWCNSKKFFNATLRIEMLAGVEYLKLNDWF